eukprot:6214675-Pleurochrysis_carterae.AAC.4
MCLCCESSHHAIKVKPLTRVYTSLYNNVARKSAFCNAIKLCQRQKRCCAERGKGSTQHGSCRQKVYT